MVHKSKKRGTKIELDEVFLPTSPEEIEEAEKKGKLKKMEEDEYSEW